MTGNEHTSEDVVRLLEACLDAKERGGEPAVEALLATRPEYAAAVRTRMDALSRAGLLEGNDGAELPERLGDFRLIERIGSGGMGVVYLAEQESLGRRVALKLVHPEHLFFPGARERFQREVEAVARLEHPGITPVYVVGEASGVPYFAMEHVAGASLDQVLTALRGRRPENLTSADLFKALPECAPTAGTPLPESWVDVCFSLAVQITDAVMHAHERGVLHRDIKPSNIMLTPSGRLRLLDFGLARSEGDARITRSGSVLGSLPYMAPEQVRGETGRIGPQTDVYAVGVTLYELLTLRPAYWSETTERTRQRVLDGRPVAIERLNSAVPWDAETVCRTAMDFDPAQRYPTMAAFSDDLNRFLRREPIQARRPGRGLRLRRWVQRQPALATGLVLGAFVVIGGPVAYAMQSEAARAEISIAYDAEAVQRQRAETGFKAAIGAIDKMLAAATDADLVRTPAGDAVRRRMLESTRDMSEDLLDPEVTRPDLILRVAEVQQKLAELHAELGSSGPAKHAARAAVETASRLGPGVPGGEELLFSTRMSLIEVLIQSNELKEAVERSNALLADLGAPGLTGLVERQRQLWMGRAWRGLGRLRMVNGDIDGSLEASRLAIEAYEQVVDDETEPETLIRFAGTLESAGYIGGFHGRDPNYAALFERGIELRRRVAATTEDGPHVQFGLGAAQGRWAHVEFKLKRWPAGIVRAREASQTLTRLADEFPLRPKYTGALLDNLFRLGYALVRNGELDAGIVALRAGLERAEAAAAVPQAVLEMTFQVAIISATLGAELGRAERVAEAEPLWQRSLEAWTKLIHQPSPNPGHLIQVGTFYDNWARFQHRNGQHDKAMRLAEQACAYHRRAHKRTGLQVLVGRLGKSLSLMAAIEVARGDHDAAVRRLEEAVLEAKAPLELLTDEVFEPIAEREDYQALLRSLPR